MIKLRIDITGEERTFRNLGNLVKDSVDFRESGAEVQREFNEVQQGQFQSGGARGSSGAWKPLAASTERARARRNPFVFPLQRTGALMNSLTRAEAEGSVYIATKDELTLGSSLPYARFHQTGTKRMPAREPISPTDEQKKKMLKPVVRSARAKSKNVPFVETQPGEVG